eukprot:8376510-Pyramimonas_sp.AAC.1
MRRQVGAAAGATQRGRCLTTLLDLRAQGQDPAVRLPQLCLKLWLSTWAEYPEIRSGVRRIRSSLVESVRALSPSDRSRHVRGPVSAVVTYL